MVEVLRYAAFIDPEAPGGGNPAGVVPDASSLTDADMQAIAAEVGFSETAFLTGRHGAGPGGAARSIRYFSPIAEVPFCGHATVATAVVLAEREGVRRFVFATPVGEVQIDTSLTSDGSIEAAFTSVEPGVTDVDPATLAELLDILGLSAADLSAEYPPRVSFAGNRHPVLVVADGATFDRFTFDPTAMRRLMDREGWAGTVTVMHPLGAAAGSAGSAAAGSAGTAAAGSADSAAAPAAGAAAAEWEARNPFPVGAITEDPATGSAAASFGAYLRSLRRVPSNGRVVIHQGRHVGRPGLLRVTIPEAGGITVVGTAAPIG